MDRFRAIPSPNIDYGSDFVHRAAGLVRVLVISQLLKLIKSYVVI
jgi:hypothetical protein